MLSPRKPSQSDQTDESTSGGGVHRRAGGAVTLTRRNLWALVRIAAGKPTVAPSQRERAASSHT